MAEAKPRWDGCVTNFDHGDGKMTIWKNGDHFTLTPFGPLQQLHPWTQDPLFQSIAKEMHRLACEVGRLRRRESEVGRELQEAITAIDAYVGAGARGAALKDSDHPTEYVQAFRENVLDLVDRICSERP